jgi:hypothetical protein
LTSNTITGNSATGFGGGVYCYQSSPTLTKNTIGGNSATGSSATGGGVYCYQSSPVLTSNTISNNTATGGGGVQCSSGSSPTLTGNTINRNSATGVLGGGGGVSCKDSSPTLANNTISGNSTVSYGGGVSCENSSPTLTSNTISGNSADYSGGGVACRNSSPTLANSTISGNQAMGTASWGGGVYCADHSSPTLTRSTISGNSASDIGGGVCCTNYSSPALINDTISGNSATRFGGGVSCYTVCSPVIRNTIVAFNSSNLGGGLMVFGGFPESKPTITYCNAYGNTGGDYVNWPDQTGKKGNISKDPLFASATDGDFHLRSMGGRWRPTTKTWVVDTAHSPCIDAGSPTSAFSLEPSPNGGRINMGAYGNTPYASKAAPSGASGAVFLTATASVVAGGVAQISVNLTSAASVQVSILNLAGREVAVLPERELPEGVSSLLWSGKSKTGTTAPTGRYLVRVTARSDGGGRSQALAGLSLAGRGQLGGE